MLAFFPTPYKDEDLRSVVYRYHRVSGNRQFVHTNSELFGSRGDKNIPIPKTIEYLINQLPSGIGNLLLENHTLIKYLTPFSDNGLYSYNHSVFTGKKLISSELRYCPACIESDYTTFGECYVHRTHQIEFINVCPIHKQTLITKCLKCNRDLSSQFNLRLLDSPNCLNGHSIVPLSTISVGSLLEEELHRSIEEFVELSVGVTRPLFISRLELWLGEKGYYSFSGNVIFRRKLIDDFIEKFGQSELDRLGLTSSYLYSQSTIQRMVNSKEKGTVNVPFFLLLMIFLSGSVREFFEIQPTYALPIPFGNGPWECLNKRCPHYNKRVIIRSKKLNDRGLRIIGEFQCDFCSSNYIRSWYWPERHLPDEKPRVSKNKMFYEAIILLNEQGDNMTTIARKLKASPTTVMNCLNKYYAAINGEGIKKELIHINEKNGSINQDSCSSEMKSQKLENRNKMRQTLSELGNDLNLNRGKVKLKDATTYVWLLKNDRAWMEQILPASKKNSQKVDWEKEDMELCQRIIDIARKLYLSPSPDKRITPAIIINELSAVDRNRIWRHYRCNKLEKSKDALKKSLEKIEDFQVRFLPVALNELKVTGNRLSLDNLRHRYRGTYTNITSDQQRLISNLIQDYMQ
ncbi:TnsD family Tn7-like transposition protein [Paenibacillus silvisoli]|uniref:TnsD family Tn7-like transposition protein n=1 Tax=Paenibacillus silvisoli TaxID=3110539 RepID=UPI002805F320|nr:TnsD family Tn7-like transposition protein [Paenibacillus silvisoli]